MIGSKRSIPAFRPWHELAGKLSDSEVAVRFGISASSICLYRKSMGIPAFLPKIVVHLCSFLDCSKVVIANGFCDTHYRFEKRRLSTKKCSICDDPAYTKGLCLLHYDAWHRLGDPLAKKRYRKKSGSGNITVNGYRRLGDISEHRLVMEGILGRSLLTTENVHHKNGNRSDNSPSNLELWVTNQPKGQRILDKIEYARGVLTQYGSNTDHTISHRVINHESKVDLTNLYPLRGVFSLWEALRAVESTTTSLARQLSTSNCNILLTLKRHPDLFEAIGREYHGGVRWRVKPGAVRPTKTGWVDKNGYRRFGSSSTLEHRLVIEQHLGRKLLPKENVHHKDGDRLNNDISNLELWSTSQPPGQRVEDLLKWAHEIIQLYGQPTPEGSKHEESQTPTRYERKWVI